MKYFDLQVNGAFDVDFSAPELTEDDFCRCVERVLAAGVTRFLPTLITSSWELYQRNLPLIAKAISAHGWDYAVPGFHLEGPFISPEPGAVGAHDPSQTRLPTPAALRELQAMAGGRVRLLTLAAELSGAAETAACAHDLGITVSLGHQLATSAQMAAVPAEALTHLGNGLPNMIHRHHNPIWSGMAADALTAMIITDGHHLPAELIRCIIRCKGVDKVVVTSDASSVTGLPPGKYRLMGGNDATLYENGLLYNDSKQCLVGSASLLTQCADFLRREKLLSEEDIAKVVWTNPHRLLKMAE
ncbi:MAG: N-acetylglucosamine-6-phosphate deacetylase [Lentisphaerae bacterium]|nr:N-acetylglucosamine-6-phosphate deacetylase [Lentisphaerota bacterium]